MSRLFDDLDAILADTSHLDAYVPGAGLPAAIPASLARPPIAPVAERGGDYRKRTLALALDAATWQARLDERLFRTPAAIRSGWTERWAVLVTAESARLDFGDAVEPREIILDEVSALTEAAPLDEARRILPLVRLALRRRSDADIFTPRRLAAAMDLRPRGPHRRRRLEQHIEVAPETLRPLVAATDPERARAALEDALDPLFLAELRQEPPLIASARLLARWHATRATDVLGNAIGRVLADLRLRLSRGVRAPVAGLAVGFRGRRAEYAPADTEEWLGRFLRASTEAAKAGLRLLDDLERAAVRLERHVDSDGRRKRRRRNDALAPRIAALLVERPAVTIKGAAKALSTRDADGNVVEAVSGETVRRVLAGMLEDEAAVEIAGRDSFRVLALPIPTLDLRMAPRPAKRSTPLEPVVDSGFRPLNDW
ncbi:hypothetical protein [Azospirillum soli]|uniref:hypothetical protein n=1 Tax=Azospirillum soli TaxID=1304799 RepID=UPI001AE6EDDB|nr:hypothetical protein [Azospirillum soli]MBP2315468.1 hypothetical protein [Azospirillum soli]